MKKLIHWLHRDIAFPYIIINIVLFVILLGIMVYSALFSAKGNHYPIPSSLEIIKHGEDISSGLSRSFSELIRGRIESARMFNEYGPRIFCFFLFQMLMRVIFSWFYHRHNRAVILIYIDVGISIVFFVSAFLPFFERLAKAFFNML